MNQQLIFNNDFRFNESKQAVMFSCLVAGLKVNCFIPLPELTTAETFLFEVKRDAFNWEDRAEQAIAECTYNSAGEIWL
jgi:hypothetical protein